MTRLVLGAGPAPAGHEELEMSDVLASEAFIQDLVARIQARRTFGSHSLWLDLADGKLSREQLKLFAVQFFLQVREFPRAVSAVHSACDDRDGRRMLAENLAEEEGVEAGKQDHASLWLMFACGLGEDEETVRSQRLNAETEALIDTFRRLSRKSRGAPV